MLNRKLIIGTLVAATTFVFVGCSAEVIDEGAVRPEANAKVLSQKADEWNNSNNPDRFHVELEYRLDELPKEGRSEHTPWPDTYWPTYQDSYNARWQGADTLSPAEKYDVAFNGWESSRVDGLRPMKSGKCSLEDWDPSYYENLGPAATYVSNNKGHKNTRVAAQAGKLKDNCLAKEDSECLQNCADEPEDTIAYCKKRCDRGGVETWWGLCHAWVPAAMLEAEAQHKVEYNGVTFEVSDIKALLIAQYDSTQAYMIGGRCNDREVERDESGRIIDDECRDTNAGSFHVVLSNFLGVMKRAIAEDKTYNYEVWNQPILEWKASKVDEITEDKAIELLKLEGVTKYPYNDDARRWVEVNSTVSYITESSASTVPYTDTINSYVRKDNYTYILELDSDGVIIGGEWTGSSITKHPDFLWLPVQSRGGNPKIDLSKIHMLLEKSRSLEITNDPTTPDSDLVTHENPFTFEIPDNDENGVVSTIDVSDDITVGRVEVEVDIVHTYKGDLRVVLQSPNGEVVLHDRAGGSGDNIKRTFNVTDLGGINASGTWALKVSDHANADKGTLNNWTLKLHVGGGDATGEANTFTASSNDSANIPDNDETGASTTIAVTESHQVKGLKVTIDVTHTYIGDLVVELKHGAVTHTLHNREGGDETSISKTYDLTEFNGNSTSGDWTLTVKDVDAWDDTGKINSWSMEFIY
jgi:subtilisin-like proprotein convertase family protein